MQLSSGEVGKLLDLLPKLSFGKNLRPSRVTDHVRRVLIREEKRTYRRFLLVPLIVIFADMITFIYAGTNAGWIPWNRVAIWEAVFLIAAFAAVWLFYSRRIGFIRDAAVTTAAVMDTGTLSLWGIQLFRPPTAPGSFKRALEEEDEGDEQDTFHLVTVRLRFVPGDLNENMDWPLLRDEVPHWDVTKRIRGGWGSFASDLERGSLVSLLYDPQHPKRCRIVRLRDWQKDAISE